MIILKFINKGQKLFILIKYVVYFLRDSLLIVGEWFKDKYGDKWFTIVVPTIWIVLQKTIIFNND